MTEMFPPFSATPGIESIRPFTVKRTRPSTMKNPIVVVSTSLYWGIAYLHEEPVALSLETLFSRQVKRKDDSWWNTYVRPLLAGCNQVLPADWQRRVYLSEDLEFLADILPEHVEVVVMAMSSPTSVPGTFWRYLPLQENVFCVARGADNYFLPARYIEWVKIALQMKASLLRMTFEADASVHQKFHYRAILGSCAAQGPLPFIDQASAWINTMKNRSIIVPHYFEGLKHTGMDRWDAFGQDEQFLNRWLYHYLAHEGSVILTFPHNRGTKHFLEDCAFLTSEGAHHHVIFP